MPITLYAQHQEDAILRGLFSDAETGYYVDIGANDPTFLSVTKYFYDRGWRGINVEPVPHLAQRLQRDRPGDLTLNIGISEQSGSLTLYECPLIHGWSTFVAPLARVYRQRGLPLAERTIPVMTMTELFDAHVDRPVDFLKIDVEGNETEVLRGIDWERCRPRVLVIENAWPESWSHLIPDSIYTMAHCDNFNRYYIRNTENENLVFTDVSSVIQRDYVYPDLGSRLSSKVAQLASRDDLGWLGNSLRRLLFRCLYLGLGLRRALAVTLTQDPKGGPSRSVRDR